MKKFILTIGPALLHEVSLKEIHTNKNIYRINGAHGCIKDIENSIEKIRSQVSDAAILMDLPGNKVRTKDIPGDGIELIKGEKFIISNECFNYPYFYQHLKSGMTAWANDSVFEFEVIDVDNKNITFLSKSDGVLLNGKGIHIRGIHSNIPFLFEKDEQLIQVANKYRLEYVGLSFVRTAQDVKKAKSLLAKSIKVISKIETLDAVNNINNILPLTEYILVDRGDLSTDIGIINIPRYQKYIIEKAQYYDVKVFLATQILKNMESKPIPTIGEIEALYEIYKSGVYGVQMSEETAVGKYVKETVSVLNEMFTNIEKETIVLE